MKFNELKELFSKGMSEKILETLSNPKEEHIHFENQGSISKKNFTPKELSEMLDLYERLQNRNRVGVLVLKTCY